MPKKVYKITQFHGGLNSSSDPRDISEDQLSAVESADISNVGLIKGNIFKILTRTYDSPPDATISDGDEIFLMKHDNGDLHDFTAPTDLSTTYLFVGHDSASGNLYIYEKNSSHDDWSVVTGDNNSSDGSGPFELTYMNVDGAIKISPGSKGNDENQTISIQPVTMTVWKTASDNSGLETINKWRFSTAEIMPPLEIAHAAANTDNPDSGTYGNYTQYVSTKQIPRVNLNLTLNNSDYKGSGFSDGTDVYKWKIAASFEYDYTQETALTVLSDTSATTPAGSANTDAALVARAFFRSGTTVGSGSGGGNWQWEPRITAVNLYLKQDEVDTDWYFAGKWSISNGAISSETNTPSWWTSSAGANGRYYSDIVMTVPQKFITYDQHSGTSLRTYHLNHTYKTGVIANSRSYIGNVRYKQDESSYITKADQILVSPVNQFDMFDPASDDFRALETSKGDGGSIVKLLEFNDRILSFKENMVTIINISQATPFVEDNIEHNGIDHKAAAFKTDYGIVWANTHGCFLYDGESVQNVLEKNGMRLIDQTTWSSHVSSSPAVFYIPKRRKIGILDDVSSSSNGHVYMYDLLLKAWTYLPSYTAGNATSAWAINEDNDPIYYDTTLNVFKKISSSTRLTPVSTFQVTTKDIDFGNPAVRKKIYKVYVSYKGDGSSVECQYGVNGDDDTFGTFYKTGSTGATTGATNSTTPFHSSTVGTDDWVLAELKPASSINNVYSFRLFFDGEAGSNFEINDISIVYREKNIK